MGKFLRWAGLVLAVAVLIGGVLGARLALRLGVFKTIKPHFEGACVSVPGLPGAEDMATDRTFRRVFVSSDDRRNKGGRGAIYLMPLDGFQSAPMRIDVTLGYPAEFHPHGISLFTAPDGRQTLFAVNHPKQAERSQVEIFDVDASGLLKHRASVPADAYPRLNDVAGVGTDSFYATVESVHKRGSWMETLSLVTREESGSVVFWRDGKFRRVASGMNFANGIALTPDGRTLYATGTLGRDLRIFDRDVSANTLHLREIVYLGSAPDNIDIAEDGAVWIAAHPKLSQFLNHVKSARARSPSQVLLVERDPSGQGGDVHQAFLSSGEQLSAASIAIADQDRLIMGGVFDSNALMCVAPQNFRREISHRFFLKQ